MRKLTLKAAAALALTTGMAVAQQSTMTWHAHAFQSDSASKSKAQKSASGDLTIERQVTNALQAEPALKNVKASVQNGVADLRGIVPTEPDRQHAIDVAKGVFGVTKVQDQLSIGEAAAVSAPAAGNTTPNTAQSETQNNTAGSIAGNSGAIGSTTGDSHPADPTTPQKSAASNNAPASGSQSTADVQNNGGAQNSAGATTTGGVAGVANNTSGTPKNSTATGSVSSNAAPASSSIGLPSDVDSNMLRSQIDSALQSEPTLSNSKLQVEVTDSQITLNGSVPSGREKQSAERIAQSYGGNRKLVDKLTVEGNGANPSSTTNNSTPKRQ